MEKNKIIYIINFAYLLFVQKYNCQEAHKFMTNDELKQTFNTEYLNTSIPKYETVKLCYNKTNKNLFGHSAELSFVAFGEKKKVQLKLYESSVIGDRTPIWMAKYDWTKKHVIIDKLNQSTLRDQVTLYETSEGSIIGKCRDKNGVSYFAGSVGNLTISPVTSRVSRKIHRSQRDISTDKSLNDVNNSSDQYFVTDYHIIYKTPSPFENIDDPIAIKSENLMEQFTHKFETVKPIKSKRELSENNTTIYPEILIYTDFNLTFTEPEGPIFNKFIIYLIAFWNNVALHFKTLIKPFVSLRVTGIIISTSDKATEFLNKHTSPDGKVFSLSALFAMGDWLMKYKHVFPTDTYDFAITMTNRLLCEKQIGIDKCKNPITIGVANIKAQCAFDKYHVEMCAIVHDDFDFSGIIPAVHELSHIIGAQHDGAETISTRECDTNDVLPQYIMTPYVTNTPYNYVWSNCSRLVLSEDKWRGTKDCLKINSTMNTGKTVSIILPGNVESLEKQCINRGYSRACNPTTDTCSNLKCWMSGVRGIFSAWTCRSTGPPLDGSTCGSNRSCILGQCVTWT